MLMLQPWHNICPTYRCSWLNDTAQLHIMKYTHIQNIVMKIVQHYFGLHVLLNLSYRNVCKTSRKGSLSG